MVSRIEKRPLNFTLPSRKSIAKMVKSFSILSYQDMAMVNANARTKNQVVSYGYDDTIKAAGNKRFDVKTARITLIGENKERESFIIRVL